MITPDEAVAAIQHHLDAGVIGYHGLYSRNQQDYREMWWGMGEWLHTARNDCRAITAEEVLAKFNALAENHTEVRGPTGVNTTQYGVEI